MFTVVTGAGGALGKTLVRALAAQGHKVACVDRSEESVRELAKEVSGVVGVVVDARPESFAAMMADCEAKANERVTGAALVAGGWAGGKPLHEGDASFASMLEANALTVHAALLGLLPGMVERRAGSVVVVGSRNVERPWLGANAAGYTASKAAAVSLAQAAAAEVLGSRVRVNAVLVSTMDTPANRKAMPDVDPSTWVSTESVSSVIAFLLSDAARDVSGAEIPIYGRA
jgi:NAD(P)-dependent dehydrogenase (short-subunit alcohol dehydrogenase family)